MSEAHHQNRPSVSESLVRHEIKEGIEAMGDLGASVVEHIDFTSVDIETLKQKVLPFLGMASAAINATDFKTAVGGHQAYLSEHRKSIDEGISLSRRWLISIIVSNLTQILSGQAGLTVEEFSKSMRSSLESPSDSSIVTLMSLLQDEVEYTDHDAPHALAKAIGEQFLSTLKEKANIPRS
ncbi:MAG: hypothetical protein AAB421_04335 [Patescibacteria group bacterium]